jgi:hypothetical protein
VRAALAACAALLAATAVAGSAGAAAKATQRFTIYAVPTTIQFMNHADDRLRGMSNNPFNVNTKALITITKGKEKGNGPFPGDDTLYSFNLFSGPTLKTSAGKAIFTCYYDFTKHAICEAYFEMNDGKGLVLASGGVHFDQPTFTLGVVGGTKGYLGVKGQVTASPAKHNAQRFDFVIAPQGSK